MELSLDRKRLKLNFFFCLLCLFTIPVLFPKLRLVVCAPFLIIVIYNKQLTSSLWIAFGCGLLLDLLSSESRLGIHALAYCLAIALIFPLRRNFFADSVSTLPIMTFCFSFLSTFLIALLLYNIEAHNVFSWAWVMTDLIYGSLSDSTYAFCCFVLPSLLFRKAHK